MIRYLMLAVLFLAAILAIRPARPLAPYTPTGYVDKANALIADNIIWFDCENRMIKTKFKDDATTKWYQESYLADDVDSFNKACANAYALRPAALTPACEEFADRFLIEGCILKGVNPAAHVVPMPGVETKAWTGQLRYAPEGGAGTLESDTRTILLTRYFDPIAATDILPVPIGASGRHTIERAKMAEFQHLDGAKSADVYSMGDTAVVRERARSGDPGGVLLQGRKMQPGQIAALEDGDWLFFSRRVPKRPPAEQAFYYTKQNMADLISWSVERNAAHHRVTRENTLAFVPQLIRALNAGVEQGAEQRAAEANLELSVNAILQDTLTSRLNRYMREFFESGKLGDSTRPRRAALTVLDLFTGEALALPTYPSQEHLERFVGLAAHEKRRLLQNQNFPVHPVGSAGKPFWASAVVSQYPFMASFTIPAHSDTEYSYAAGMELDSTFEDHRHPYSATAVPGRVALDGFLKESCNKYVVDFVTATLAMKDEAKGEPSIRDLAEVMNFSNKEMPVPERFAVCGSTAERVPKFDRFVDRGSFHMPEQNPVHSTFESITGVRVYAEGVPGKEDSKGTDLDRSYRSKRFVVQFWEPAALDFRPKSQTGNLRFLLELGAASPERVNFAINKLSSVRGDWVSLLLGGGTGLWNNVQLAEALARIITGRQVQARIVGSPGKHDKTEEPAPIQELDEGARAIVMLGMSKVADEGTASALQGFRDLIADRFGKEKYDVFVYAKTGTATVDVFAPSGAGRVARTLFDGGGIEFERVTRKVRLTSRGAAILKTNGFDALFRREVERMNRALPLYTKDSPSYRRPNAFFYIEQDKLLLNPRNRDVNPSYAIDSLGAALIVSVLVVPQDRHKSAIRVSSCLPPVTIAAINQGVPGVTDLDAREAFGLSLALYIEDTEQVAGRVAVPLMNRMAGDIVPILEAQMASRRATVR